VTAVVALHVQVARTLVAFEYLWYQAWLQSIETAKAGLQATLIIRHPDDGKLYVNFDQEILQLIREAKCLDRMGIEIPESAKIVLLQENKFKAYFNDLSYALREYARITDKVIPVTASLLKPHIADMEFKLRPGMITLTWTSMNIDAYKHHVYTGLQKLDELVHNINDIIENRIEKNLKIVSKTLLVDLPRDKSFTLDDFVRCQQEHIRNQAVALQGKNIEIEHAVEDLVTVIQSYALDPHIEPVSVDDIVKLRAHYNHFMYQALLNCSKNSLNSLKKRVASRESSDFLYVERPFFEVDVQLAIPDVRLSPDPSDVQLAMNKCAVAVIGCNKRLWDWGQHDLPEESRASFFERVTDDMEIARVILLLTGSIQGTKKQVNEYLQSFIKYDWLWKDNADALYATFMKTSPELDDYERELMRFDEVEHEIDTLHQLHNVGALSLNTMNLKAQLKKECADWKIKFCSNLHKMASAQLLALADYMKSSSNKLQRPIVDIDSLRFVMNVLKEIRERESGIDMEIDPVLDTYKMLDRYLPENFINKDEMDQKDILKVSWRKLVEVAESVTDEISRLQGGFKKKLLSDVKSFVVDVVAFRNDYLANGPMVKGISPQEAMERLRRYQEEFELRSRKYELYSGGEELFALRKTEYPELEATQKELELLQKLYSLYRDVMSKMDDWKTILWSEVVANVAEMSAEMESFAQRCKKLPKKLREWEAYNDLKKEIEDTQNVLPLLQDLSKASIKDRHWEQIAGVTGHVLNVHDAEFRLANMLEAKLVDHQMDIEEICDGADKQLAIEIKLKEIADKWAAEEFHFTEWKGRGVQILMGVTVTIESLEEDQMNLQTMLTMRCVAVV
jgi:dynein heavy chain